MSRKSPRLAAKAAAIAKVFEPRRSIRIAIQARAQEREMASRERDPVEQLYYNDRDAFFEMSETETMILRNKFIKNLYIQRGIFQPCKDVMLSYRDIQAILIQIDGVHYWLFCGIILELKDDFQDIGDVWDDSIHM
jgi:hypothetical protein